MLAGEDEDLRLVVYVNEDEAFRHGSSSPMSMYGNRETNKVFNTLFVSPLMRRKGETTVVFLHSGH